MPRAKKAVAVEEPMVEEMEVLIEEPEVNRGPKRYEAYIYLEREPIDKDLYCGAYVYRETTDEITCEYLRNQFSSDLEGLVECGYICRKEGREFLVDRMQNQKEWLMQLPFAYLGRNYYCKNVEEYYEAE